MGQKVNPIGMRVGINRTWDSRWYAGRDYADKLVEDLKLREYIFEHLKPAGVSITSYDTPSGDIPDSINWISAMSVTLRSALRLPASNDWMKTGSLRLP